MRGGESIVHELPVTGVVYHDLNPFLQTHPSTTEATAARFVAAAAFFRQCPAVRPTRIVRGGER
jgi:hypothetical protein